MLSQSIALPQCPSFKTVNDIFAKALGKVYAAQIKTTGKAQFAEQSAGAIKHFQLNLRAKLFNQHVMHISKAIDQAKVFGFATGPECAGEHVFVFNQRVTPACFNLIDKLLVNFKVQIFEALNVGLVFRLEGVKDTFVFACSVNPALNAQFFNGLNKTKTRSNNADRAYN